MTRGMTRENAIEKLKLLRDNMNFVEVFEEALDMAIEVLRDKPKGEWIDSRDTDTPWNDGFKCSACKSNSLIRYNFCPNCGKPMLKKDSETE